MNAYAPPRDPTAVLGRRGVAYLIDGGIALFVFILLFFAMAQHFDKRGTEFEGADACPTLKGVNGVNTCFETTTTAYTLKRGQLLLALAVPALVSLGNLVALQGATGGSIGKQMTGLRVVDDQGNVASVGRMFVRWLMLVVDSFCVVTGMIVAAVTRPHRRIGDYAAHTYVVARKDVGTPPEQGVQTPYGQAAQAYAAAQYQTAQYQSPQYQYQPPGAPASYAPPPYAPAPQYTPPPTTPSAPVWDAQRGAWVSYDPVRRAWLRYDDATRAWRDL